MNKKIFKLLFIFILFLLCIIPINALEDDYYENEENFQSYENIEDNYRYVEYSNGTYKLIINDEAGLLSSVEIKKLKEKLVPLLEYGNIAFVSTNENPYYSTDSLASKTYKSYFKTESGTLFLIDMARRNIYIFSDGSNYRIINNDKAYIITDNVYRYATNKLYYDCAYKAFDQIETLLKGGKILEPMRYITNALISITLGSFIAFFIAVKMTSIRRVSDKELIKCINRQIIINSITGKKTGTHREYSPRSDGGGSSGGSSGGGGGGGGGGGSSGGGGGHGF